MYHMDLPCLHAYLPFKRLQWLSVKWLSSVKALVDVFQNMMISYMLAPLHCTIHKCDPSSLVVLVFDESFPFLHSRSLLTSQ